MRKIRIYTLLMGGALLLAACTSYEEVFNRNLDSTGLYVTNSSSNTVSQFAVDPKSGILNDLGTVAAGTTPVYIAVNSAGTFAYVVNSGSNDVYVYSINKKTRKLTFVSSAATDTLPRMIGLHSGGKFAYVVNETNNRITGYSVDAGSGALTSLGAPTATGAATSRAIAISDNLLYVPDSGAAAVRLFGIDSTSGVLTPNGTPSGDLDAGELPVSILISTGNAPYLYLPCANNRLIYFSRSPWPPVVPPGPTPYTNDLPAGTTPVSVALTSDRGAAFVSNSGSANISAYTVSNGVPTAAGTISTCSTPGQMLITSQGFAYLVCNGDNTVRAHSVSGASLTLIKSYPVGSAPTSVAAY